MKLHFIVFCFLISNILFGQNLDKILIVDFEYIFVPKATPGFASTERSTLKTDNFTFELSVKEAVAVKGRFSSIQTSETVVYTGLVSGNILYKYGSNIAEYTEKVVKDELPEFKWVITNESKKIGKYNCKKATTTFRGSQIIAYFTEEIPFSVGPFKFKGLPGLILEVISVDEEHRWIANKVRYDDKEKHPLYSEFNFANIITLKEDMKEVNEYIEELQKKNRIRTANIAASIEGLSGVESKMEAKRAGIEKIYEWELEESEKN